MADGAGAGGEKPAHDRSLPAGARESRFLQGKWSFLRNMLKLRRIKGLYNKLLEFGAYLAVTVQKVEVMCRQLRRNRCLHGSLTRTM
jgi:hypothetical protein